MATTLTTLHTDFVAAITALALVSTDVYDVTNGILKDEATAAALSGIERAAAGKAATLAKECLETLESHDLATLLLNIADLTP